MRLEGTTELAVLREIRNHGAGSSTALRRRCRLCRKPTATLESLERKGFLVCDRTLEPWQWDVTPEGRSHLDKLLAHFNAAERMAS